MKKYRKELLLLLLPVLALAGWGLVKSQNESLVPRRPIPLEETAIKEEVARQVTQQLSGGVWKDSAGWVYQFEKFVVTECRLDAARGQIEIHGVIACAGRRPTQATAFPSGTSIGCLLRRNRSGSHFTGTLGVPPGKKVPRYFMVPISIPVQEVKAS